MPNESKLYKLIDKDRKAYLSPEKGQFGGHSGTKIYGRMDCSVALRCLKGPDREIYIKHRVFFKDEETALATGYRPCGICLKDRYALWKQGQLKTKG